MTVRITLVEQGYSEEDTEQAFAQRGEVHLSVNDLDQFLRDELEEFVSGGSIGGIRWNKTKTFVGRLSPEDYRRVIKATKEGLREVIANYVKETGGGLEGARFLYMTNLSNFCLYITDHNEHIQKNVSALGLNVQPQKVKKYSEDVCGQFAGFTYNASNKRFFHKFGEDVVYVVDDYELP